MCNKPISIAMFSALCVLLVASIFARAQDSGSAQAYSSTVQEHIDAARLLAGSDLPQTYFPRLMLILPGPGRAQRNSTTQFGPLKEVGPPAKAFDQLYFFGLRSVCSWALVTSAGIIQIDTLDNADEARDIIEAGYKKMGLDPTQIKYILISHGHGDHYGGAKYLVDKYHPHVLMGKADWDMLARMPPSKNPNFSAPPARDIDVMDGQQLTLGNTTLTLYITPGHTPATISTFIPVTDHGQPHLLALWGGTGMPLTMEPTANDGGLKLYQESLKRFIKIAEDAKVDGFISNHPLLDGSLEKAKQVQNRKVGDPNPWVTGLSTYVRYAMVNYELDQAIEASIEEGK